MTVIKSGGSVEAFLKLDATQFREGLETATTSVEKFKESMLDIGKQGNTFKTGVNNVSQALDSMIKKMELLDTVDSKAITKFKQVGLALEHMATGAQRLGADARRGAEGVELLNTVMDIFQAEASSVEITLNATLSQLRNLKGEATSTKAPVTALGDSFSKAKSNLLALGQGIPSLNRIDTMSNKVKQSVAMMDAEFKRAKEDLLAIGQGTSAFNRIDSTSNRVKAQIQSMNAEFERSRGFLEHMAWTGVEAYNKIETGAKKTSVAEKELNNITNQVSANMQKQSASTDRATSSINRQASATRGLTRAFSSLKMMGTMVGSMLVYNFAHNLITATRETVNAKSEMEGYFKMLNFAQKDIDHFNKALDNTVQQFQRVNKYSLGETISSIGVEFDLSTKEMEKAMKVTSMITSEYLRAGRNANEASLAVKDVLQGQFQRLSRETGVKGEQLKEAGWSGDTTDVLGLMEALEKVGKSRNWDVFAEKANSLNDIVTILQNRFGEWSAEMVYEVQPSIVNAFNTIMSVATQLSGVLSGAWSWFNGDGLVETAVRWGTIATAIGTVTTALVSYRTGANLTQMVQMGLRGSIVATTLGLKAEEVATYGSRNAIAAKLTSIEAETVAEMGVRRAILTKVIGLEAESVANMGVKGAIMESVLARKMEEAEMMNATTLQKISIASEHQAQVAKMGTLRTIFAKVAGVNLETYAEKGLIVALAERVAESPIYIGALKAEEVAEMSTASASLFLTATLTPLIAILAGVAIALYSVIKPLQDASEEMKNFNYVVDNSDQIMKDSYATQKQYRDEVSKLKGELENATKGTKKYKRIQDQLKTANENYAIAQENVKTNIKATNLARDSKNYYNTQKEKMAREETVKLANAYIKAGYSATEASEMASSYYRDAEKGAKQLRNALSRLAYEDKNRQKKTDNMLGILSDYEVPKEKVKELVGNFNDAYDKITEGMDKFMTSDDLMERIGGWFEIQQGRFEAWWTELNAFFEVRDWDGIRDKLIEGIKYVLTGFGAFDWISWVETELAENGLYGTIMNFLFGEGESDGAWDIIADWGNNMIIQPLGNWIIWFLEDPVAHFQEVTSDLSLSIAKFLFGKDETSSISDMLNDWFNKNIVEPIVDHITHLPEYILQKLGEAGFNFGKSLIEGIFGKNNFASDVSFDDFVGDLFETFTPENINKSFESFGVGDTFSLQGTKVANKFVEGSNIGLQGLGDVFTNAFDLSGVETNFTNSTSNITTTATSTASKVGSSFTTMKNNQKTQLDSMSNNNTKAFTDMKNHNADSLTLMKEATHTATSKMASAFSSMKDSVLKSSSALRSGSTNDFNILGNVIKAFYNNIQNPSKWGGTVGAKVTTTPKGAGVLTRTATPPKPSMGRRAVRTIGGSRGAGINPYQPSNRTMSIRDLMNMVDVDEKVPIEKFLAMFSGGFGDWDFNTSHQSYIKSQAYTWDTAPASITGIGQVGHGYKVDRWKNGRASFTWDDFTATAQDIFSRIPYKFYYNSDWKGSWVNALLSGAVNCSDGADALINLARVFGFDGYKQHTTLKSGVGHFFAVINGKKMDTTNFQNHGSWSPLGGGIPVRTSHSNGRVGETQSKTVNVTNDFTGATIYGVDDLDSRIKESTKEAIREEFNDPWTVPI